MSHATLRVQNIPLTTLNEDKICIFVFVFFSQNILHLDYFVVLQPSTRQFCSVGCVVELHEMGKFKVQTDVGMV